MLLVGVDLVLILVVLEDGLGDQLRRQSRAEGHSVLILIVLEDGLGVNGENYLTPSGVS